MKPVIFVCLIFSVLFTNAQNLLTNGGFETYTAGTSSYMTTGGGNIAGLSGQWQLSFSGNNYPTCSGASCGTTLIDNSTKNSGNNSLQINITKHTNRNDIRLFQTIGTPPTGNTFVVTFYMKSDLANYPVVVNVFKSTEASNSNGACTVDSYCQAFTTTTAFKEYKMYVDLSTWSVSERTNMRISVRPNTGTSSAAPSGTYPKIFWFDDFSFNANVYTTTIAGLKDVAIQVANDRKQLALDSGFTAEANALATEITALTNSNPSAPTVPTKALGFNPVPTQTTAATNPFIAAMYSWAAAYLAQNATGYGKATTTTFVFPKTADCRTLGSTTENLLWLLVSPLSDYRYNSELFKRLLTIVYATSDDYKTNGTNDIDGTPGSTTNAMNDWFAASKTSYSWQMVDVSFADYIPNTLKQRLRDATDSMGKHFYNFALSNFNAVPGSNISVNYSNRDVNYAEILMHVGMYRNNTTWVNFSKRMVDSMNLVNRYPDGAYSYIEKQNETADYHGGNNNSLAKIWAVSEYQPAWDCISKTAMYELMSVEPREVAEFNTAPAWKTEWNGSAAVSAEPLLAITQNPYLKTRYNQFRVVDGYDDEIALSLAFYNPNISALPLPDNYIVYDRNIRGPRGRYGRFSYTATGRNVAVTGSNDCGLQTVVGAIETIPGRTANIDEMDAALMVVHSKVHITKRTNPAEWTDWGYMMSRTDAKSCIGRTVSTISTPGVLQYQTSGPSGYETNWSSYQQWITLPDRIIGFVETYPTNNVATTAYEIDGRVRFTYGRQTGALLNPKYMITEVAGSKYSYGKFKTIIHGHDFTTVSVDTAGVLRDDYRNSMEIIFRYNLSNGTSLYSYPGTTKKYFMVEIRDSMAVGDATVSRVINGNVKGLVVKLNGKSYASYRNDGAAANVDLSTVLINGNTNHILFSRGDSAITKPITFTGTNYTVPANEQVLIISTNTPATDTGRAWQNYPELLAKNGNYTLLPVGLVNFSGNNSNAVTYLNWQTSSEINADRFEVEKSTDGINFTKKTTEPALCKSGCTYKTSVAQTETVAYYRLKIIDKDGSFTYSQILTIKNIGLADNAITITPNPVVNRVFKIEILNKINKPHALKLVDATGKTVYQQTILANTSVLQVNLPNNIFAGQYILQVTGEQINSTNKIIVL